MHIRKAVEGYHIDLLADGKSPATVRWYMHKLRYFTEYLEAQGLPVEAGLLRREHILGFLVYLRSLGAAVDGRAYVAKDRLSSLTVKGYAQVVKTFCRWLRRNGLSRVNAAADLAMPRVDKYVVEAFTADEVRRMLQATQQSREGARDHTIILLLYDTAMRLGELTRLTLDDVDMEGGWVKVRGKGARERVIPVGRTAKRALWRYIAMYRREPAQAREQAVFLNQRGEPLSGAGVYKLVRQAAERAGVRGKRLSPHTLRHAAAEDFLRNGGDAFTLQKLLGHTTLAVTRMYVDLVAKDVAEAHKRASPGDNLRLRLR